MDDFDFDPTDDDLATVEEDFDFDVTEIDPWANEIESEGHVSLEEMREREFDSDNFFALNGAGWDEI
jgi:hypothetical protein